MQLRIRGLCIFQLNIVRINDFVALIVTETADYKNSGQDSSTASTLSIETPLYVGGVPSSVQGPFSTFSNKDVSV